MGEIGWGDGEGQRVNIPEAFQALSVAEGIVFDAMVPQHSACGIAASFQFWQAEFTEGGEDW
ncbi:MAG: hypothetical protein ACO34E_03460 [Limisphaerales bacterium]